MNAPFRPTAPKIVAAILAVICIAALSFHAYHANAKKRRAALLQELNQQLLTWEDTGPVHPFEADLNLMPLIENVVDASGKTTPRAYEQAIWDMHKAVMEHLAKRLDLDEDVAGSALEQAERYSDAMSQVYMNEAREEYRMIERLPDQDSGYSYRLSDAARSFSTVLGRRLCDFVMMSIKSPSGPAGKIQKDLMKIPCNMVLSEVLLPINQMLEEQGLLADYLDGRERVTGHLRHAILELVTVEHDLNVSINQVFRREILLWESQANLSLSVSANVKAGFDLLEFFSYEIKPSEKKMIITLPLPEITSVQVFPNINTMEDGWFVEIDANKLNETYALARARAQTVAIEQGILVKAKENAELAIMKIMGPIAHNPHFSFDIEVRYREKDKLIWLIESLETRR